MAARFPDGSGNENPPDGRAAGRERGPITGDRSARALAAIAGRDRDAIGFRRKIPFAKKRSGFRPPAPRTSAIHPAYSRRTRRRQGSRGAARTDVSRNGGVVAVARGRGGGRRDRHHHRGDEQHRGRGCHGRARRVCCCHRDDRRFFATSENSVRLRKRNGKETRGIERRDRGPDEACHRSVLQRDFGGVRATRRFLHHRAQTLRAAHAAGGTVARKAWRSDVESARVGTTKERRFTNRRLFLRRFVGGLETAAPWKNYFFLPLVSCATFSSVSRLAITK